MKKIVVSLMERHGPSAVAKPESPQLFPTLRIDEPKGLLLADDTRLDLFPTKNRGPLPVRGKPQEASRHSLDLLLRSSVPPLHSVVVHLTNETATTNFSPRRERGDTRSEPA